MTFGVNAIITNQEKYLLVRRKDLNIWTLPGGAVEHNEDPVDAVIREALEETGTTIKVKSLNGVYIRTIPFLEDVLFVYETMFITSNLKVDDESYETRFFSEAEINKKCPRFVKKIINNYVNAPSKSLWVDTLNNYELSLILRFLIHKLYKILRLPPS